MTVLFLHVDYVVSELNLIQAIVMNSSNVKLWAEMIS